MVAGPEGRGRAVTQAASASVGNGSASFFGPHVAVGNLRVSPGVIDSTTNFVEHPRLGLIDLARNPKFASISLQRRVINEPESAPAGATEATTKGGLSEKQGRPAASLRIFRAEAADQWRNAVAAA